MPTQNENKPIVIDDLQDCLQFITKRSATPAIILNLSHHALDELDKHTLADSIHHLPPNSYINLSDTNFFDDDIQILVKNSRQWPSGIQINLRSNFICTKGVEILISASMHWPKNTIINLTRNSIGDDGVELIAAAIKKGMMSSTSLENFSLCHNNIGDRGAIAFADAMRSEEWPSSIKKINLSANKMGSAGVTAIIEALLEGHRLANLQKLNLKGNAFSNACLLQIATAVTSKNWPKELKKIDLRYTNLIDLRYTNLNDEDFKEFLKILANGRCPNHLRILIENEKHIKQRLINVIIQLQVLAGKRSGLNEIINAPHFTFERAIEACQRQLTFFSKLEVKKNAHLLFKFNSQKKPDDGIENPFSMLPIEVLENIAALTRSPDVHTYDEAVWMCR